MEKDQPDSLATVAVVSEKMPQTHSHYAPSEVYSSAEPPPAYMRPPMKSTAVQIARIAAITLIAMSIILGSFILAASWVQARASCTPESIAATEAETKLRGQAFPYQQGEFLKHLQPEALVQEPVESKENLQTLSEETTTTKQAQPETKDIKIQRVEETGSKAGSNDNDDRDDDNDDDDYTDDEFPPVHIKLPLQFDFDEIAGTLIQEARSRVSCVVERRRADQVMDGTNNNNLDNSTDPQRFQRLSGERVAILCESGNPQQEQQEQEMLTPIIIPLGTVQVPLQSQEQNAAFNSYQVHTQYQVPDMQQLPLSDPRGLNHIPPGVLPSEPRNVPQTMGMRTARLGPLTPTMGLQNPAMGPQVELRQIPIELRRNPVESVQYMRPPPVLVGNPKNGQNVPTTYEDDVKRGENILQTHVNLTPRMSQREIVAFQAEQTPQIEVHQIPIELRRMPVESLRDTRPLAFDRNVKNGQNVPVMTEEDFRPGAPIAQKQINPLLGLSLQKKAGFPEQRIGTMVPRVEQGSPREQLEMRPPFEPHAQPAEISPQRSYSAFDGIPLEIRKVIEQLPFEIKNIIQHINSDSRPIPVKIPEGARRENTQDFKPFPDSAQPIPLGPFPLPVEVKNLLEHGNIEGRQRTESLAEEQEAKSFPGSEDESAEERNFPVPAEIRNIIHQVVEGRAFPVPRFAMPLRPVESFLEVPVEAHAEVSDNQTPEQETEQRQSDHQEQQSIHVIMQQQQQQHQQHQQQKSQQQEEEEETRPHYVQPRSVRSVPEAFSHRREKRVRRCACDCAC